MSAYLCIQTNAGPVHVLVVGPELDAVAVERYLLALERTCGPCDFTWQNGDAVADLGDLEEAVYLVDEALREERFQPMTLAS